MTAARPRLQTPSITKGNADMAKIRSNREFSARIDAAFETQKTRDEANLGLVQVATRTLKLTAKAA